MYEFKDGDVKKLRAELESAAVKALPGIAKVVEKGALNIRKDWRAGWQGHAHAPGLARTVTYDVKNRGGAFEAEIGPDKGKGSGPLGNIYEFGTPRNAPMPAGGPALTREEPKFEKALADCLAKLLEA